MIALIWIIEIINVSVNIKSIIDLYGYSNNLGTSYGVTDNTLDASLSIYIIEIFVSIVFCLAITIAYVRARRNKDSIKRITDYLEKKFNIELADIENSEVMPHVAGKAEREYDNSKDNIPEEDECPICFYHIAKNDTKCPNCGTKLKN